MLRLLIHGPHFEQQDYRWVRAISHSMYPLDKCLICKPVSTDFIQIELDEKYSRKGGIARTALALSAPGQRSLQEHWWSKAPEQGVSWFWSGVKNKMRSGKEEDWSPCPKLFLASMHQYKTWKSSPLTRLTGGNENHLSNTGYSVS